MLRIEPGAARWELRSKYATALLSKVSSRFSMKCLFWNVRSFFLVRGSKKNFYFHRNVLFENEGFFSFVAKPRNWGQAWAGTRKKKIVISIKNSKKCCLSVNKAWCAGFGSNDKCLVPVCCRAQSANGYWHKTNFSWEQNWRKHNMID